MPDRDPRISRSPYVLDPVSSDVVLDTPWQRARAAMPVMDVNGIDTPYKRRLAAASPFTSDRLPKPSIVRKARHR